MKTLAIATSSTGMTYRVTETQECHTFSTMKDTFTGLSRVDALFNLITSIAEDNQVSIPELRELGEMLARS